ncbi:MAG: cation:proton antiporter [Candidatus Saccharicenans sp.]
MFEAYLTAAIWLSLALLATILASRLKISMALMEIMVGAFAGYLVVHYFGESALFPNADWLRFVAGSGAILLTFLAGSELDPQSLRAKLKESTVIGFSAPFLGCTAIARYLLHWDWRASLLAGIALSTTSIAVVYSVMPEFGFNKTEFGKGVLGSCFVNDLGTVIGLGLIFAPFTYRTAVFVIVSIMVFIFLPGMTELIIKKYAYKTAAVRTKWILFWLFSPGALALWSGSEAVLPAYIIGMVLAGTISRDHFFIRRIRTLTIGFLTPFYFLRAGFLMSIPAILSGPLIFLILFGGKVVSKIFGLYPAIKSFRKNHVKETWYYTLMMSTGLTFGAISAFYGLTHNIISRDQYPFLVAALMASAVIPTLIANRFFLPEYLLPAPVSEEEEIPEADEQWQQTPAGTEHPA